MYIASQGGVSFALPESLHAFGTELANGHMPSIAGAIIENKQLVDLVWQHFLKKIDQECSVLCEKCSPPSPFCSTAVDGFQTFQWKDCINYLTLKAPTLLSLLSFIVQTLTIVTKENSLCSPPWYLHDHSSPPQGTKPRNVWSAVPHLTHPILLTCRETGKIPDDFYNVHVHVGGQYNQTI